MSSVDLDAIKGMEKEAKLKVLRQLRNELIGSTETKLCYFNKSIIETFAPMLSQEEDEEVLNELIVILNSYFFYFPQALEILGFFKKNFVQIHTFLKKYSQSSITTDNVLRISKNLFLNGIVKPSDFQGQQLIESLAPLMTNKFRTEIIARILSVLCKNQEYKKVVAEKHELLQKLVDNVTVHAMAMSDQCLESCLAALASISNENEEASMFLFKHPTALKGISMLFRHPERRITINVSSILTSVNAFVKLGSDFQHKFRWIMIQMIQILPSSIDSPADEILAEQICDIISSIATSSKDPRLMQKVAGDVEAIEKLCDLLIIKTLSKEQNQYQKESQEESKEEDEDDDNEMEGCVGGEQEQIVTSKKEKGGRKQSFGAKLLHQCLFETLASLTSAEESCRKRLLEKKKILDELMLGIQSQNKRVKLAALNLFVSLSRSDKMLKAIILEHGQFQKEITKIVVANVDYDVTVMACKSLCNFAVDNQKQILKEENLLSTLVKHTSVVGPQGSNDLRIAAIYTLKNLLFNNQQNTSNREMKSQIMKELGYDRLLSWLDDSSPVVQEQALIAFRNLLARTEDDVQGVLSEGGERFLKKLEEKLGSESVQIQVQATYVLSSIAAGNQKHKKLAMEDKFFMKTIAMLKSTESPNLRIGCLNLIINLAWKETDNDSKVRRKLVEMNLADMLRDMLEQERDQEARVFFQRAIKKLT